MVPREARRAENLEYERLRDAKIEAKRRPKNGKSAKKLTRDNQSASHKPPHARVGRIM